jgi:hypothetical protein
MDNTILKYCLDVCRLRILSLIFLFVILSFPSDLLTQDIKWKRDEPITQPDLQLFHSPHVVDLPTATTLKKWDLEFEISHRFVPPLSSGIKELYGFDGPVNMRLALGLALSDRLLITIGRSNVSDNLDLWVKYKFFQYRHDAVPILAAAKAGVAWNSQPEYQVIADRSSSNSHNYQYFGQLIINTLIHNKLGIGLVPAYLYNSDIRFTDETKDTFSLGVYTQYYVSPLWSIYLEWNPYISGYKLLIDQAYDSFSYGIELETGGHFFKIFLTNNKFLNTSQYLAGADIALKDNDWRLGFMITRLLRFTK